MVSPFILLDCMAQVYRFSFFSSIVSQLIYPGWMAQAGE
jgi:hypothetical protein